ncbi:hypothetical protein T10_4151 [Trichinella papuae]|uniref:Uncharacterized protein n=1 Tax=Trichinella papuae TaxID=268474 RepID=A0A0V1M004_9BILA|nr:hypothetical protein T10_4151 [Trichinella papuae]
MFCQHSGDSFRACPRCKQDVMMAITPIGFAGEIESSDTVGLKAYSSIG